MQKNCLLIMIIVLILPVVASAGNIYTIDFSKTNEHTIELALKEGIETINPKGIIIFNKVVNDNSIDLKFFRSDNRLWGTFSYKLGEPKNVDINIDHKDDFIITVLKLENNKITLNIRAYEKSINEEQDKNIADVLENQEENVEQVTGQVTTDIENKPKIGIGLLITTLIVIAGLLIYSFFIRKTI